MEKYALENEFIKVIVNDFGAELSSLIKKDTGTQYLWNADEKYWKRHSPVLFPIVGSLKNKEYEYNGKKYSMSQHGFARDRIFRMISKGENFLIFHLEADEATKKIYPFDFELDVKYELEESSIKVKWNVVNRGKDEMYFSIGAHPAFMCPLEEKGRQDDYYLEFDAKNRLSYHLLNEDGLYQAKEHELLIHDGICQIAPGMFDKDALVMENNQAHEVSLLRPDKSKYLTVAFDAPLFGLWSPAKRNAPFICIEPWFGRCDSESFCGTIGERKWGNNLKKGEVFSRDYSISIY